ncbi:uncharacterized protein [Porites lutea]|uniref:uncharacterized protein isoform X4 n=1 Tax=Porites lutea TaxID=51062 RepID=UPI003CC66C1D
MVLHFNGRYRKVKECDFLEQAEDELAKFHQNSCKPNSVLVFPPLKAHYRFLIHQLVGEDSRLHSVSIGEGQQRRTVVYFACVRSVIEMAQSPSTPQRTFFGRGRGRKTRRPDQQLYVPGALRQARWEQQEQKLSKEGAVEREENEIISTDNAAGADALSRSTVEEFSDKCFGQECDSQVDESKINVVDGTQGSGNIQDQQRNINCTSIRGISSGSLGRDDVNQIDGKELKNEEVTTIARDSTMATCESAPRLTYITANNGSGSFDSQFLNTETNGDKFDDINYKGVIDGTGSLQISSTCADRDNGAAENSSADASEDFKMLNNKTCNGTDRMTLHNQFERASNENLVSVLNQKQDDPLLKANKGLLVKETTNHRNGIKSKVTEDGEVISDHLSEVAAVVDANHDHGMAKVGNDEIRPDMKSVSYSDVPMTYGSYAVDCSMEKIQNKIIGPKSVQQSALLSSATQEYTESNFGTNVLTLCEQMPAAALTDSLQETSGGRTLSRLTGIDNPEVQKTQYDFYSFTPRDVELDDEEFGHIVEIYNFSPDLKTQDLMQALSMFRSKGFDIKWVDDTHALGIFSSHISAEEAIKLCSSPLMKLRPVSQGTPESRKKATNCFEFLQPYKERPQTSKLLADRLVTGALGIRSKLTREDRVKEREKLKEAKNKKQQEKIQKAQMWGD